MRHRATRATAAIACALRAAAFEPLAAAPAASHHVAARCRDIERGAGVARRLRRRGRIHWRRRRGAAPRRRRNASVSLSTLSDPLAPLRIRRRAAAPPRRVCIAAATLYRRRSLKFYGLFGFEEEARFRSGAARCAWLRGARTRLELIEVPPALEAAPAADGLGPTHVGWNHVALDVSDAPDASLAAFLRRLNADSERLFRKSVRLAAPPRQQLVGGAVYELAFVSDPDGALVELVRLQRVLEVPPEVADW